jgi:hypothetical protein
VRRSRSRGRDRSRERRSPYKNEKSDKFKERRKESDSHKPVKKSDEKPSEINKQPEAEVHQEPVQEQPKIIVKGRGALRQNDSRSLLGWEDEDYEKTNKRLSDTGRLKIFRPKEEKVSHLLLVNLELQTS